MLLTVFQRIKESYMSDIDEFVLVVTVWDHEALPCDTKYSSRKHLRTKVTPDLHLTYRK